MPLSKKHRADLAEFLIAGGLTAMAFATGDGSLAILAGIAAGVGRSWTGNLARRSFQSWRDRWLTDAGVEVADGVDVEISPLWASDGNEVADKIEPETKVTKPTFFC